MGDQALQNRWAICKCHRKMEPQGQDHLTAMDENQNPFYFRVRKDARQKWRNNHGPRGIWNRKGIQCDRGRRFILGSKQSAVFQEGHTGRGESKRIGKQTFGAQNGTPPNTTTNWILCPTNGIWHDARSTSPIYLHPDSASIIPATTTK